MFQYFSDDFGNFENLVKIWTRAPPNYYQNGSKNTRKNMDSSWKKLSMSIWDSTNSKKNQEHVCIFLIRTLCILRKKYNNQ